MVQPSLCPHLGLAVGIRTLELEEWAAHPPRRESPSITDEEIQVWLNPAGDRSAARPSRFATIQDLASGGLGGGAGGPPRGRPPQRQGDDDDDDGDDDDEEEGEKWFAGGERR